jgi:hypothetical protein
VARAGRRRGREEVKQSKIVIRESLPPPHPAAGEPALELET